MEQQTDRHHAAAKRYACIDQSLRDLVHRGRNAFSHIDLDDADTVIDQNGQNAQSDDVCDQFDCLFRHAVELLHQHVDADVFAPALADADAQPGHPDEQHACQFIRTVDRTVEELSQDHVDEENHQTARQHRSKRDLFDLVVNASQFL